MRCPSSPAVASSPTPRHRPHMAGRLRPVQHHAGTPFLIGCASVSRKRRQAPHGTVTDFRRTPSRMVTHSGVHRGAPRTMWLGLPVHPHPFGRRAVTRLSKSGRRTSVWTMATEELPDGLIGGHTVAASLLADVSRLADDMLEFLVQRIPEAAEDAELRGLTLGSCSSNLEAALSMVRHGIDVEAAEAPVTALEHARAMAARGHSVDVMLRFYRLGHEYFVARLAEILDRRTVDRARALSVYAELEHFAFRYIDRISSLVAAEYVAELDRRQNQARAERAEVVRDLLAGTRIPISRAERVLRHRLSGTQIAFVCWTHDRSVHLERHTRLVATALGSAHCLLMADGPLAFWGWVASAGKPDRLLREQFGEWRRLEEPVHLTVGAPHDGTIGFRLTHLEAVRARRIVEISASPPPSLTLFSDVALVDALSQDLEVARLFVRAQLGDLARDTVRAAEERSALLAFLDSQGSLVAAAHSLNLHRNTVLKRVRRAEARRGAPATAQVAELHAALRAAHVLGAAVLIQA